VSAVGWGFLGAGAIASNALAPAVHRADGAVLVAAAARDPARAAALEPTGRAYADYLAVCDDPSVDVVYVALANDAHLPWTLRALASGKHVLCEKPLGLTAGEVREMVAAATSAGRVVVEASWYRWHPRTRRAEELVAGGFLGGDARDVQATFTFSGVPAGNYRLSPVMGGGALYDVGCYAVSAAQWALGPKVRRLAVVRAVMVDGDTGVDLTTAAVLVAATGRASVHASFIEPERQQLRVTSSTGSLSFDGQPFTSWHSESWLRLVEGGREWAERFDAVDPYQLMVEAVSAAVRGEPAYVVPTEESIATAAILDAIRGAVGEGAAPPAGRAERRP
jgi:predicted dehydrogenase